jgi:DNA-binding transcriptional LysR family regulator
MRVPSGVNEHGLAGHVVRRKLLGVDTANGRANHTHHDAFEIGELSHRETREIGGTVEPVIGAIEIRASVRHHRDTTDMEGHTRTVCVLSICPRQVVGKLGPRNTWVRGHSLINEMTEINDFTLRSGHEFSVTIWFSQVKQEGLTVYASIAYIDIDAKRLQVLAATVRAGGVIEAGHALNMSPQAVSQQIGLVERQVGTVLFDRTRRRLEPTELARALAVHGDRVDAELLAARRTVAQATGQVIGTVRVGTFQSAIRWLVVSALPRVREAAPGVTLEIVEISGDGLGRALRSGQVDLIIDEVDRPSGSRRAAIDDGLNSTTVSRVLRQDPYQLVVPREWSAHIQTLGDALNSTWIAAPSGSACRAALDRIAARHRLSPKIAHTCLEFPAVLALVEAGEGVAIIPRLGLSDRPVVDICEVRGLGARDLVARQRNSRRGTAPAVDAVVAALVAL